MSLTPYAMEMVRDGIRPEACEATSKWTEIKGKLYMLPVISRELIIEPVFEGEDVKLRINNIDAELTGLLEKFFNLVGEVQDRMVNASQEAYINLLKLYRKLILKNYNYDDKKISEILTCKGKQRDDLFTNLILLVGNGG